MNTVEDHHIMDGAASSGSVSGRMERGLIARLCIALLLVASIGSMHLLRRLPRRLARILV